MRDLLITFFLLGSIPAILMRPYVGLVMWFVLAFLNPHQMAYGFVTTMPVAMLIGGSTLVGFVLFREPKRMPIDATTGMIMALMVWITVTTLFALKPEGAWPDWDRAIKLLGMTLLMIPLLTNRQRLQGVIWAIVLSVDFYGIRGGVYTLTTAGGGRVLGPPNTMLEDNNQLATALIMILPLIRYLQIQTESRWVRLGLLAAMLLTTLSVFGSYSRGALIGLAVMFIWMFRSSRHKTTVAVAAIIGAIGLALIMPASWYDRMNTIESYQQDGSATGRIDAWKFAFRLALERPLTGGGFRAYTDTPRFLELVPEAPHARAFHSIYFEALGEHGFVGLGIFLAVIALGLLKTAKLRKLTRDDPQRAWAYELASMVQVCIVGYIVAGAFLELTFFDLFYAIVIMPTAATNILTCEDETERKPTPSGTEARHFLPARLAESQDFNATH